MTAMTMNSTLFLLNVLALAVLTGFHFYADPVAAEPGMDVAGTVRRASCSEVAAVSCSTCCGITVTERGVSTSGAVYFWELAFSV